MPLNFKAYLNIIVLFLVGSIILFLVFKEQNLALIFNEIKSANYTFVVISAITVLFSHFIRALRWQLLIQTLGGKVKVNVVFYAVMVGYLANLVLPRLGEASRCGVLKNKINTNFAKLMGTVITERLIDLLSLLVLLIISIILEFDLFYQKFKLVQFKVSYSFYLIIIILFVLSLIFIKYLFKNNRLVFYKLYRIYKQFKEGINSLFILKNKRLFFLYTLSMWFLYILSIYIAFYALNETVHLNFKVAFLVLIFGSLGMIAPVQGGIGAFHFMVSQCLMFYSIDKTTGLSFATIIHSSQIVITLLLGFYSLFQLVYKPKNIIYYDTARNN